MEKAKISWFLTIWLFFGHGLAFFLKDVWQPCVATFTKAKT